MDQNQKQSHLRKYATLYLAGSLLVLFAARHFGLLNSPILVTFSHTNDPHQKVVQTAPGFLSPSSPIRVFTRNAALGFAGIFAKLGDLTALAQEFLFGPPKPPFPGEVIAGAAATTTNSGSTASTTAPSSDIPVTNDGPGISLVGSGIAVTSSTTPPLTTSSTPAHVATTTATTTDVKKDSDPNPSVISKIRSSAGGFVEKGGKADGREKLSRSRLQNLVPTRGEFEFPAPYHTTGIRLTNADDCGGNDCVDYVGYSYWRNINDHEGSNDLYAFVGLNRKKGGKGPTLFRYDKTSGNVKNLGPMFDEESPFSWHSGEMWYFSGSQPSKLYVFDVGAGSKLLRYDIFTKKFETVFDAADSSAGKNSYIWQPHSSDDDNVHMATLRDRGSYAMMGCIVYQEDIDKFSYYPAKGNLDECNLDKSGKWLVMLDNVDYAGGLDNRIIEIATGKEKLLMDEDGGAGHLDMGYGVMVGEDNWYNAPAAVRLYDLDSSESAIAGPLVYKATDWSVAGHIAFGNAKKSVPIGSQYACGSYVQYGNAPRGNEIVCFRLDGSLDTLVVAPVMTDLSASGGGDDYAKAPKGNLDVTGQYFIWSSNMGGARQDIFMVKVPGQLLSK